MFTLNKNYLKIIIVLIFSFFLSNLFIKNIFLANSPQIRPNLDKYFLAKINNTKEDFLAMLRFSIFQPKIDPNNLAKYSKEQINAYLKNNLKSITKGVKAATLPGYSYVEFKVDEIIWTEITYTLKDGRKVKIKFPKGTTPPPKEIFE